MPRHARRPRRRNLALKLWHKIVGGLVLLGGVTALGVTLFRRYRALPSLDGALEGALPGLPPLVGPTPPASGAVGDLCENIERYPGFVWDGAGCVPGETTPPGIYLRPDCTDFVFKDGGVGGGAQADLFAQLVAQAKPRRWNDPIDMTTTYLTAFWPECPWPPAPTAPARIVQLFMALSFVFGREILIAASAKKLKRRRARVLGQSDLTAVDEAIAEQLSELGLSNFDLSVVPEIQLPVVPTKSPFVPGETPGPTPGGIVPTGDFPVPGEQGDGTVTAGTGYGPGGEELPLCAVLAKDDSGTRALDAGWWDQPVTDQITLLTRAAGEECKQYRVVFGLCLTTRPNASYGTLTSVNEGIVLPPSGGFKIDAGFGQVNTIQVFKVPGIWKAIYEAKIIYSQGGGPPQMTLKKSTEAALDACSSLADNWPPLLPGIAAHSVKTVFGDWRNWNSEPKVKLVATAWSVRAEITYAPSLPSFVTQDDEGVAVVAGAPGLLAPTSQFDLAWKSWSIGEV